MKKIVICVILLSFFINAERSYITKKVSNKLSIVTEKKSKFYKDKRSAKFFNGKKHSINENQGSLFRDHTGNESKALVLIMPGEIELTLIPFSASSIDKYLVIASKEDFDNPTEK